MLIFPILSCHSQNAGHTQSETTRFGLHVGSLILLTNLLVSTVSSADTFEFEVLYADVPGVEQALAGNIEAAIEILENRAKNADDNYVVDERATLCALYVVAGDLDAARRPCNAAVDIDDSDLAYNNRGVLRARLGDAAGAVEDFARARVLPGDQHRYIEELKRSDARLMAGRNFEMAVKYSENRRTNRTMMAGAEIESIGN